jgi:hypothetical protein
MEVTKNMSLPHTLVSTRAYADVEKVPMERETKKHDGMAKGVVSLATMGSAKLGGSFRVFTDPIQKDFFRFLPDPM